MTDKTPSPLTACILQGRGRCSPALLTHYEATPRPIRKGPKHSSQESHNSVQYRGAVTLKLFVGKAPLDLQ